MQPIYLLYRDLAKFMQHSSDVNFLALNSQKIKNNTAKNPQLILLSTYYYNYDFLSSRYQHSNMN